MDTQSHHCPLCESTNNRLHFSDKHRDYYRCNLCRVIFVPPVFWLSADEEKAIYDYHENSPNDSHYRQFLSRLTKPLQQRLKTPSFGLDFGCGPGPTLSIMLQEQGHQVAIYDHFYADNTAVFNRCYDFITATEVIEHLHYPRKELERLWQLLTAPGYLGLMTKLIPEDKPFSQWHYKNDLTHIIFYAKETMQWIAQQWQADLTLMGNDVILLQKNLMKDHATTEVLHAHVQNISLDH